MAFLVPGAQKKNNLQNSLEQIDIPWYFGLSEMDVLCYTFPLKGNRWISDRSSNQGKKIVRAFVRYICLYKNVFGICSPWVLHRGKGKSFPS